MKRKMAPSLCSPEGGTCRERGEAPSNTSAKKSKAAAAEAATPESPPRFPKGKGCVTPVEQEILQGEWEKLCPEDKAVRRAQRARRGERCTRCGCVGYFRRNCPTCPPVRFDVRRDRWRLVSVEDKQKSTVLRGQPATTGEDSPPANGAGPGPGAQKEVGGRDKEFLRNVAGRGYLWGPLAEEAVSHQAAGVRNNGDDKLGDELGPDPARKWAEDTNHELPGNVMVGGESPGSSVGGTAEVTLMMPSLSGSSAMSSGVISGFRRALVWADGGGGDGAAAATATCPSVVSCLDDIPWRGDGSTVACIDSKRSGKRACFSEFAAVSDGDSTERPAGGENGAGSGAVGYHEKGSVVSNRCGAGMAKLREDGDHDLVRRKLTWRWPEFRAEGPTLAAPSFPAVQHPSPSRGYGGVGESDDDGSAFDCERRLILAASEASENSRCLEVPRASGTEGRPPKPPKGSYLRNRGTMVLTVQENLHLALERLAEAVREQVRSVCSKPAAEEMLKGPRGGKPTERYYEASTRQDFRDFFDAEEEEAASRQQLRSYAHLGALREDSKARYLFDRTSHSRKGSLVAHLRGDYQPQPEGYRGTNVHAATDWRRQNTSLDRYASSGRDAMTRIADSEMELKKQGVWVRQQMKAREQRRQRANHLLEVYRSELLKEQLREIEVLHLSPREQRLHAAKTMQEQVAAADRIMRATKRYGLTGNMEDAHYVMYAADAARRAGLSHAEAREQGSTGHGTREKGAWSKEGERGSGGKRQPLGVGGKSRGGGRATMRSSSGNIADGSTAFAAAAKRGVSQSREDDNTDGEEMSPYSLALPRPGAAVAPTSTGRLKGNKSRKTGLSRLGVMPGSESTAALEAHRSWLQSERLRTFSLAGHPLRKGADGDTTAVPALIPIPEGFGKADERGQRSHVASRIMEALREGHVDSITGRKKKLAVPLWHRATEEIDSSGAGSVLYSDLIGHTYSVLTGPKQAALAGK